MLTDEEFVTALSTKLYLNCTKEVLRTEAGWYARVALNFEGRPLGVLARAMHACLEERLA